MTSTLKISGLVSALALIAGLAMPTAVHAQTNPDNDAATTSGLEEIIVTARKISENLQDVPIAVTAFTSERLEQTNTVRIRDVALYTPGVYSKDGTSARSAINISIRGQFQADILATLDPSVGTYVDGFYWARAYGANADLLDVQDVQVLRGPQGTLFGRNTTGGALLVQSNDPSTDEFSGKFSATYGRFNQMDATGALNVPLGEKAAVRVAGGIRTRDGYIHNTFDGHDYDNVNSQAARVKLLLAPSEAFRSVFSAEYFFTSSRPQPMRLGFVEPGQAAFTEYGVETGLIPFPALIAAAGGNPGPLLATFPAVTASLNNVIAQDKTDRYGTNSATRDYARTLTLTNVSSLDTDVGTLKFVGGYRKVQARSPLDVDGTTTNILNTRPIGTRRYQQNLEQWSTELQLTGKALDNTLDYATGVIYFREKGTEGSQSIALQFLNPSNPNINDGYIRNKSAGVYGQLTYHVTDKLSATGGLRYSRDWKGLTIHNRAGVPPICTVIGATPAPDCAVSRSDRFSSLDYTVGLDYKLTDDVLIYAKTAKGYRSGGQNLRATGLGAVAFQPFKPETAYSYEAGFKSEFFDRKVRLNVAAYYVLIKDIQKTTTFAVGTGPNVSVITRLSNAGKERVYGLEGELTASLFPGFELTATGAITKPKYLEYMDNGVDRRNDRITFVSKYTGTLGATYTVPVGSASLSLHGDMVYGSAMDFDTYNNPADPFNAQYIAGTHANSYVLLNARVAVDLNEHLQLAAYGKNLTNNREVNNGTNLTAPLGYVFQQRREPTTYGVTATFKFGGE